MMLIAYMGAWCAKNAQSIVIALTPKYINPLFLNEKITNPIVYNGKPHNTRFIEDFVDKNPINKN